MIPPFHSIRWLAAAAARLREEQRASQIAEFAISLPLLVVFVVGIFDFSGAFSLKQKLATAAAQGAQAAAADPANDLSGTLSGGPPVSVSDAWQVVDNYLVRQSVNDCGLKAKTPTKASGLTWSATSKGTCPGSGITLTVNRACVTQQSLGGVPTSIVDTCVTIAYPYAWRFNSVSALLGNGVAGPTTITTKAVAYNEN